MGGVADMERCYNLAVLDLMVYGTIIGSSLVDRERCVVIVDVSSKFMHLCLSQWLFALKLSPSEPVGNHVRTILPMC